MRLAFDAILGGILSAALAGAAVAQQVKPPAPPASAPAPMTAASRVMPTRSAAVTAAENDKESATMQSEERVIPQISVPLKRRNSAATAAPSTSAPAGSVPGTVNDRVARCMALGSAGEKAACERAAAASRPVGR